MQDTLITILSEKTLPMPELNTEVQARKGFNVIATANNRDKGVNELSSALMRRFNTVVLPVARHARGGSRDRQTRVAAAGPRPGAAGREAGAGGDPPRGHHLPRAARRRDRRRQDQVKSPSGTLSTAEAISVMNNGLAMAGLFTATARCGPSDMAAGLIGAVVKDPVQDRVVWQEYLQTVVKERDDWKDFYRACHEVSER